MTLQIPDMLVGIELLTMVCRSQQGGKIHKQASNLNILIEEADNMIVHAGRIRDDDSDHVSDSDASDCSRSDILGDIRSYTICLMELVPSMERTFSHMLLEESQTKQQVTTASSQVSESAQPYVQNIFDKFPGADIKLIERLGEANWKRHTIVRLRMDEVSSHTKAVPDKDLDVLHAASEALDYSIESSKADRQDKSPTFSSTPFEVNTKDSSQCKICGKWTKNITQRIAWR